MPKEDHQMCQLQIRCLLKHSQMSNKYQVHHLQPRFSLLSCQYLFCLQILSHNLGIYIILLPPSESGNYGVYSNANYDWKCWIDYFNSLKRLHPLSFVGFVMDDFNAIDEVRRLYVRSNMNYLFSSNLSAALAGKRNDIQFFPVMYVETGGFNTLKRDYDRFLSGIILAKATNNNDNENNSTIQLDSITKTISTMFKGKQLKYILHPERD